MADDQFEVAITGEADPLIAELRKAAAAMQGGMNKMQKTANKTSKQIDKTSKSVGAMGAGIKKLAGALALAFSASKIFSGIWDSFQQTDSLGKTAKRLGLISEELAALHVSAGLAGIGTDTLDMALQRMTRRVDEASRGLGEARPALKELGLDAKELAALDPAQQFEKIRAALNGVATSGGKVRLAFKLFDSEGVGVVNMLGTSLEEASAEARKLGVAMTAVDVKRAEEVNDTWLRVKLAIDGIFNSIAKTLAPSLILVGKLFVEVATTMRENMGSGVTVMEGLNKVLAVLASIIHGLMILWEGFKAAMVIAVKVGAEIFSWFIRNLQTTAVRFEGFFKLIELGMDKPQVAFDVAWAAMRSSMASFVNNSANMMKEWSIKIGGYIMVFDEDLGKSLINAASDMTFETGRMAVAAEKNFNRVKAAAEKELPGVGEAARKAFGVLQESDFADSALQGVKDVSDAMSEQMTTKMSEALEGIKNVAGMFGGETAFAWSTGVLDALDAQLAAIGDKTKGALGQQEDPDIAAANQAVLDKQRELDVMRLTQEQLVQQGIIDIQKGALQEQINNQAQADAFYKSSMENRLSVTSGILGNLATLMNSKSKSMFKIGKAAAISQAVVDTWASANKAMATLPYPVNLAAAAATVAAGMVNVQNIASRQFGTSGAGGGGGGGGASAAASAEPAAAPAPAQQTFNIGLQGQNFSGSSVRGLLNQINDQLDDNAQINVRDEVQ